MRIADFGLQKNFAQFHALTVRRVMNSDQFKKRTKEYGLRIVRFVETLPKRGVAEVLSRQLVKSGTSVGANYRSACRARSRADFIAKMGIVEEECDESVYWMEMLIGGGYADPKGLDELMGEGNEILSMIVASIRTARSKK